jgi:hypothetical protein
MAVRDDAETLAIRTGVMDLATSVVGVVVAAFVWRERGGYRVIVVQVVKLARRSNARVKLIVDCRSTGCRIAMSNVIGSPRPIVNKFISWVAERPSQRQSNANNCR